MAEDSSNEFKEPKTLQEAINIIKFLTTSHKQEIIRLKQSYHKRVDMINKLESNRKQELEFLSSELHKYEIDLALRTEAVSKQLIEKDTRIQDQEQTIEKLNNKVKEQEDLIEELNRKLNLQQVPEINILIDSNSDSGIAMENDESQKKESKPDTKPARKCSRRFADSIGFLRRVDFSPMKYKPRDGKKKEEKKNNLEVPCSNDRITRRKSDRSDDERINCDDSILSDSTLDCINIRSNKINDSMNNHFSDDGSEDTSEEVFDRVMTRSSIRRSVKANPKYKKINRCKSKLLEQVKLNIVD